MRVELASSYVLHTRAYRNTSLLVDAVTAKYGLIRFVAKGALRDRSRLADIRHLFYPLALSWVGQSDLKTLIDVQPAGQPNWLTSTALMSGLYVNELLIKLLDEEDPHPDLFDQYALLIHQLAKGDDPAVVLRFFEKRLVAEMGFGLSLNHADIAIEAQAQYCFDPECGIRQLSDRDVVNNSIEGSVSGATLIALQQECLESTVSKREARVFLGMVIAHCLGGTPLQSPLIWRQSYR
jgi:DNA repair protein RecO (recombination protein O)